MNYPGTMYVYRMQLHTRRMKNGGRIKIDMLTLQCLLKTQVMRCTEVPSGGSGSIISVRSVLDKVLDKTKL